MRLNEKNLKDRDDKRAVLMTMIYCRQYTVKVTGQFSHLLGAYPAIPSSNKSSESAASPSLENPKLSPKILEVEVAQLTANLGKRPT
jgi:hypothetical protein